MAKTPPCLCNVLYRTASGLPLTPSLYSRRWLPLPVRRWAVTIGFGLIGLIPVFAKKENPLERLDPVPAGQPIPIVDFFRPWLFTNPELNPAGTHFAAIVSTGEDTHDLVSFELAAKKMDRMSAGSGYDVVDFDWLGDERLLFEVAKGKLYANGLYAVELGHFSSAYVLERYNATVPIGYPKKKPHEAVLWISHSAADAGDDGGVVRIDTRRPAMDSFATTATSIGNEAEMHATIVYSYPKLKGTPVGYLADRDGELAFGFTAKDGVSTLHRLAGDQWVPCAVNLDEIDIEAPGDAPGELFVLGPRQPGKPRALQRFDVMAGKLGEPLFQDERYDLDTAHLYRSPVDGRILGIQYHGTAGHSYWFDPSYHAVQLLLEKSLPHLIVRIIGSDRAQKHFFVSASSDVRPPGYYHLDLEAKSCSALVNVAPWIDPGRMQPMRPFNYKTRDGFSIEGFVTLPAGASKANPAPLVVLPHGGPWARDIWCFDPEVQFLASRGYAVFQPNYRGSTDYQWMFPEGDMWDFLKMHNDVTDGVKELFKTGLIDADRVAIMGASFGGYLAISGVAHEPDLYRCAITVAGVFDWEKMLKDARSSSYFRGRYGVLRRNLGDPKKTPETFAAISPIRHVSAIKVPVFVAHGSEDMVASASQSGSLITELKRYGVPFEKLIESDEGHGFHQLENQIALYTAIEQFLAKNLAVRDKLPAPVGTKAAAP